MTLGVSADGGYPSAEAIREPSSSTADTKVAPASDRAIAPALDLVRVTTCRHMPDHDRAAKARAGVHTSKMRCVASSDFRLSYVSASRTLANSARGRPSAPGTLGKCAVPRQVAPKCTGEARGTGQGNDALTRTFSRLRVKDSSARRAIRRAEPGCVLPHLLDLVLREQSSELHVLKRAECDGQA